MAVENGGGPPPPYRRIKATGTMAMEVETVLANIEKSFDRAVPTIWTLPEVWQSKGDLPLAIVAGGPSLRDTLDELGRIDTVMVCGSAHDYVISLGIVPRYCVVTDPDPIAANYLRTPHPHCTYLVCSMCDDTVFAALAGYPVALWHSSGIEAQTNEDRIYRNQPRIGGGCTVTLRALMMAIVLGYHNQHYFGFDSCVASDAHHAYPSEDIGGVDEVRLDGSDRVFYASGYMMAQAYNFQILLRAQGHLFTPTIHGDGLIAEIMRVGQRRADTQEHKEVTYAHME